jgi:hypothetical protein
MPIAKEFKAKRISRVGIDLFTPEQAAANRELLGQHLREAGLVEAANVYFQDFWVGNSRRYWLLPTEDWSDLNDVQVDYVLKHWSWFRATIAKLRDEGKLVEDDISY